MKKIFITLMLFTTVYASAQIAFYDAVKLNGYLVNNKFPTCEPNCQAFAEVVLLLKPYLDPTQADLPPKTIIDGLRDPDDRYYNPFLADMLASSPGNDATMSAQMGKTNALGAVPFASTAFNVANFADGVARFLVERAKQELSVTFFKKFKDELSKQKDLQLLFPTTYAVLNTVDTEIYNFNAYLTMIREAFIKDLQVIIPNVRKVITDPRHADYFSKRKPLRDIFLLALAITEGLQHGEHPGDILHDLNVGFGDPLAYSQLNEREPNIKPGIQLLDMLVQSVRSRGNDTYLVPADSIRKNLLSQANNFATFKIYLGLLYYEASLIEFRIKENDKPVEVRKVKDILDAVAKNGEQVKNFALKYQVQIQEIVARGETVNEAIKKIKVQNASAETRATYNEYYAFYDATLNLFEYISNVPTLLIEQTLWGKNKDIYFFTARKLGEIYIDVNQKKYASVILDAAAIYDTLRNQKVSADVRIILEIAGRIDGSVISVSPVNSGELQLRLERLKTQAGIVNDIAIVAKKPASVEDFINQLKALVRINSFLAGQVPPVDFLDPRVVGGIQRVIDSNPKTWTGMGDSLVAVAAAIIKEDAPQMNAKVIQAIVKYGNFAAAMVSAEDSKQVQQAIEAIALPPGSSAAKTHSFSVTLNGYVGGGAGFEAYTPVRFYGVSAPVGVAFNFGTNCEKGIGVISPFISVIDVGAFATYRVNDANANLNKLPEVTFKNILAPGFHVVAGRLFDTPLAFMVGAQYGPSITKVDSTGATVDQALWRINASITVDIPIFSFFNKPHSK